MASGVASGVASCVASGARRVGGAWRGNEGQVCSVPRLKRGWMASSCFKHGLVTLGIALTSHRLSEGEGGGVEGVGVGGHGMGESMDVGVRGWLRVG